MIYSYGTHISRPLWTTLEIIVSIWSTNSSKISLWATYYFVFQIILWPTISITFMLIQTPGLDSHPPICMLLASPLKRVFLESIFNFGHQDIFHLILVFKVQIFAFRSFEDYHFYYHFHDKLIREYSYKCWVNNLFCP